MDGTHQSLKCCAVKLAILVTDILETFLNDLTSESKHLQANMNPYDNRRQPLVNHWVHHRVRGGQEGAMQACRQPSPQPKAGGACPRPQQQLPMAPVQEIVFTFNPDGTMTQRVAPVVENQSRQASEPSGRWNSQGNACPRPSNNPQPRQGFQNQQGCGRPQAGDYPSQSNTSCMARETPQRSNESMTLQELDNLCARRQREIERNAQSQGFSCGANSASKNQCQIEPRESLGKTLDIVVSGLERIVKTWEKSIETGKQEDPTDPEQLSRVLAERLLNKSQNLEKQQKEIEEILKGLKNIVPEEINTTKLNTLLDSLQSRQTNQSKCPHCCSCGASLKNPPPQSDPPPAS